LENVFFCNSGPEAVDGDEDRAGLFSPLGAQARRFRFVSRALSWRVNSGGMSLGGLPNNQKVSARFRVRIIACRCP
jgi:hypothetical protein